MIERLLPLLFPALIILYFISPIILSPLRVIPGPKLYALTKWRLAWLDYKGTRTRQLRLLHNKYGPVIRIGPNEVSFASPSALRTIYGPGSNFGRTEFYSMFDVYGRKNLFTFLGSKPHAERKRLLSHMYSKSSITGTTMASLVERKVEQYTELLKREPREASEIFTSLHYFSIDAITDFVYGDNGRTSAMAGDAQHRTLLNDILDPARRRLSWFAVHLPQYTKWLLTRTGLSEAIVTSLGLLPMKKPTTYTGIRKHALEAFYKAKSTFLPVMDEPKPTKHDPSVLSHLLQIRTASSLPLTDLDIASECADHLLAGIDTTADTLMFVIWALSLPEHAHHQHRLRTEISNLLSAESASTTNVIPVKQALSLPYLDAVLKETLRLYTPLPASEPRSSLQDSKIDGFTIPAYTVVSASPYILHRDATAFPDPLTWDPDRWLGGARDTGDAGRRTFWAFSSGARMCIGMHLAMAEMACLVATIYARYQTSLRGPVSGRAPAITSRFELFYDEIKAANEGLVEHECWVDFEDTLV